MNSLASPLTHSYNIYSRTIFQRNKSNYKNQVRKHDYNFLSRMFFVIHGMKCVTRVYTPGYWPLPQPMPHETMPTWTHWLLSATISGPPESPCQLKQHKLFSDNSRQQTNCVLTLHESLVALPAHSIDSIMPPGAAGPYLPRHSLLLQIGMVTSCSTDGVGPSTRGSQKHNTNFIMCTD